MSKTFGLKFQSRVLRPFPSDRSAWIVATNTLREENEIRVVEFDEKSEALVSPGVYVHCNEVWDLAVSPLTAEMLMTVHNSGTQSGVTLWSMKEKNAPLVKIADLGEEGNKVQRIEWHDQAGLISLEDTRIRQWDLHEDTLQEVKCGSGEDLDQFSSLHVSNSDPNVLYVTNGQGYQVWDLREMKKQHSVSFCHDMPLRSIDTCQHLIATCGDDCMVRIWDNRNLAKAVLELNGHSHWVWDCAFSQKYPSLLLSASSDASVLLWNIHSSSSSESPRSVVREMRDDCKAHTYTDHDESVYAVNWSLKDEWMFASLSYDGRLAVNKVPSEVKYQILI